MLIKKKKNLSLLSAKYFSTHNFLPCVEAALQNISQDYSGLYKLRWLNLVHTHSHTIQFIPQGRGLPLIFFFSAIRTHIHTSRVQQPQFETSNDFPRTDKLSEKFITLSCAGCLERNTASVLTNFQRTDQKYGEFSGYKPKSRLAAT